MFSATTTSSTVFSLVRGHLESQSRWFHVRRYVHHAGGVSAMLALAGVGVALVCFGASSLRQKSAAAEQIGASIARAIVANPIQATPVGTVTIAPGSKVDLAKGSQVELAPNQTVTIDPSSKVTIARPTVSDNLVPTASQLQASDDDKLSSISTSYTIFRSQPYRAGRIDSAWSYSVLDVNKPVSEFCSYVVARGSQQEYKVTIAKSGIPTPLASGPDFKDALQKCVWSGHVS